MIELIPVAIDTITASIGLAVAIKGTNERPPKIKTQINNVQINLVAASSVAVTPTRQYTRNNKTGDSNGDWAWLIIWFFCMLATLRFYCQWEAYFNATVSAAMLVGILGYQAFIRKFELDKKTKTRHQVFFLSPILFHGASLIVRYYIDANITMEQYRTVYGGGLSAAIGVWFESLYPASFALYVIGQVAFAVAILLALSVLGLELYVTSASYDNPRPKWIEQIYDKFRNFSQAPLFCLLFLLSAAILRM